MRKLLLVGLVVAAPLVAYSGTANACHYGYYGYSAPRVYGYWSPRVYRHAYFAPRWRTAGVRVYGWRGGWGVRRVGWGGWRRW